MNKITALVMAFLMAVMGAGYGAAALAADSGTKNETVNSGTASLQEETTEIQGESSENADDDTSDGILVVYFSRTGENYAVGVIDKGNTAIVADMIAEETGAEKFEIVPVNAYPESYDEMLEVAQQEASGNALPEYLGDVENWDDYDTVFIGYPIWYGNMPRILYTFLERHDWSGKTVIPFDTHAGSGLSATESEISDITGADMLEGLAVRGVDAQGDRESVRGRIRAWIEKLGL